MHWFGFVNEFSDTYCKSDDDMVYHCFRCAECNNARDELIISSKAMFLSPLASFKDDL